MTTTNNINLQAEASAIMLAAGMALTNNNYQDHPGTQNGEVFNMNSNLLPCICVAMYDTILSPSEFESYLNDGEDEFYYDTVDWDDWKTELTKAAQDYLDEHVIENLENYGLMAIEATGIWSPKYYNYHQDELNMDVTMADNWQDTMKMKIEEWRGRQDVENYIKTYWHSYDGYVNFMPESLDEILAEDNEDRQLAAYLTLAMVVEGILKPYDAIMEDLYYRMSDFSDYQRVNVIEEYYTDAQEAEKMIQLWDNDDEWNELYWNLREKIGSPWRNDNESDELTGIKDDSFQWTADSDGKRLLFWAVQQKLTVKDLYNMAA